MYAKLLRDARLYESLLDLDLTVAEEARSKGCPCGGPLHQGHYPRKPRGGPESLGASFTIRFSYCCGREGCRRRMTPPSVRFLARFVYLGAVVVLTSILAHGLTAKRARRIHDLAGVDPRTVARWCEWWRRVFAKSRAWKAARGRLRQPVDVKALPGSLLRSFSGSLRQRLVSLLRFLGALTSTTAPFS